MFLLYILEIYFWGIPNTLRMGRGDTSARLMVHTKYQLNLAPKFSR